MELVRHKYKVGQVVVFFPARLGQSARPGSYKIMRHMPAEGADNQYRIKCVMDGHERVVRESELGS